MEVKNAEIKDVRSGWVLNRFIMLAIKINMYAIDCEKYVATDRH